MSARGLGLLIVTLSVVLCPTTTQAQVLSLTATSANVSQPGTPVTIRILRWSTDEERSPLLAALNPPPSPPPAATVAAPPAGGGPNPAAGAAGGGAREGRGGARGRGARGRGRGDAAPVTPIAAFTAAIEKAPTIGYIWTTDVTGYSIKYAYRMTLPDGGERIILVTDRRLGAHAAAWKPAASVTDYEFTIVEMRLNAKGLGEGKTSLTTRVIVDGEAKTVALDDYQATPAILQNVKRSS